MAEHNDLGILGEEKAVEFLVAEGYNILDRNFRFDRAEVDIICEHQNELIAVEVKTRASSYLQGQEETVGRGKQKSIIKATNNYIQENEIDLDCRFDIISIILNEKEFKLEHLKDAFWPTV